MGTLLDDLRWVREASTALLRMPDPFHHPEPWMNLLDNENEWSKALRQLDVKCSRPRKSEGARYMSVDQLLANPQDFVRMLCPATRGDIAIPLVLLSVINIAAMVAKTRSDAPLWMIRALRAVRRLVLVQKRWITSLTEQSGAGKPF